MEKLTFKLHTFEGPLDLLSHLIKKNKLNICTISLIEITDQYIEYLNNMETMDLDISSDFLLVASNLLYIKSKALLPKHEEDEDADEIAKNLTEALKERERMKHIANNFKKRQYAGMFSFYKEAEVLKGIKEKKELEHISMDKLISAFMIVLDKAERLVPPPKQNFVRLIGRERVTVKATADGLLATMRKKRSIRFENIFDESKDRSVVVATFLAVLELIKANLILAYQDENGELYIKCGKNVKRDVEFGGEFDGN